MEEIYGYFSFPDAEVGYFAPVTREEAEKPLTEEGGCVFVVESGYIKKMKAIMDDPSYEGRDVFVEISGDEEHIFIDEIYGSVFGFMVLPETGREGKAKHLNEQIEYVNKHRRFKTTYMAMIMPFWSFKKTFQIRSLN